MAARKRDRDKVFDNNYNTGNLDDFSTEEIVLNEKYKKTFLNQEYNSDVDHRIKKLSAELYKYVEGSPFEKILTNKKLIKRAVPEVLEYILPFLDEYTTYTFAERFFVICDLLNDVKETVIYENLPVDYKDTALKEIKDYSKLKKREDSTRLF
jgi:hypothetical protein